MADGSYDQSLPLAKAAIAAPSYRALAISRPGYLGTPLASGPTPAAQADLCAALGYPANYARSHLTAASEPAGKRIAGLTHSATINLALD